MVQSDKIVPHEKLLKAIGNESEKFYNSYLWLEKAMSPAFFEDITPDNLLLVTHNLMGFHLQDYFSTINLKNAAIVMCLDSADADLRILKNYSLHGIRNYQAYISDSPPPVPGASANLRIAMIYFTEAIETVEAPRGKIRGISSKDELRALVKQRNPSLTNEEFEKLFEGVNTPF